MKNMLKGLMLSIICITLLSVSAYAMPDLQTMYGPHYITDDTFSQIMTYDNVPIISSWDVDVSGGTISSDSSAGAEWFRIKDTSKTAPVRMSKKLRKTENCIVTMETSFKMGSSSTNSYFRLSGENGEKDIFKLFFSGGKFCIETRNGTEEIQSFMLNTFYGVKLVMNLETMKYDFYFDGRFIGTYDFCNEIHSIDFVEISTDVKKIAEIYMNGLKIHTGYELNEQFFAHTDGRIGEDWNVVTSSSAKVETELIRSDNWPDYYSAHFSDISSVDQAKIEKKFKKLDKHAGFEVKFAVSEENQNFTLDWKNGNNSAFQIVSKNNGFYLNGTKIYDYVKNVWYIISIEADFLSKKADIYLNNRMLLEDVAFNASAVDGFSASTSITKHSEFWLDDIWAYEVNEPENYVPEPQATPSEDFIVGMQTCDMWREGSHLGWDNIVSQPWRIPMLGFYDDGSREAADWDIKWMVEHGIDYRLTCWFTPRGFSGESGPIKKGSNPYGLLEGTMRAKYSDKMKYTIMWENMGSSNTDYKAFKEYIVPYWIEYFIKDPRYLVVDNKPVIYLYLADNFLNYQCGGDYELARETLDYLRDECKKLGFDGATIIASRSGYSEEYAADIGCDGIYNYIFGISAAAGGEKEADLADAKERNKTIFVQPSISMGREESAWLRQAGAYSTVEDFKTALKWVRDDFYEGYENYTLSEKLIMLPTWNEYGEGHYIAPCGLEGFGYLNAVREVFTDNSEYTPILPSDEQKRNYSILYPENREAGMRGKATSVRIPDKVVKEWSGEELKKWTIGKMVENYSTDNGVIKGTSVGIDPSIMSDNNLGVNIDNVTYVKVRIKQEASNKSLSMFFIRDDDTKWNEAKGVTVEPTEETRDFYDVYFPVWMRDTWKGTLKQLRIDPLNAFGEFEIMSVELLEGVPSDIIKIALDGEEIPLVRSTTNSSTEADPIPVLINGTFYMPMSCYQRFFGIKPVFVQSEKMIRAATADKSIQISTEIGEASVNGKSVGVIKPEIYQGLYVIPLRSFMESLGYGIEWDSEKYTAYVTSPTVAATNLIDPAGTWEFNEDDDLQSWEPEWTISQASVMGGTLKLTAATSDPQFYMRNLKLDAAKCKVLRIRLKNSTKSNMAELFFATSADKNITQKKSYHIDISPNDEDFVEYEIYMDNEAWNGEITTLRFDPTTAVGDMEIDYIRFSEE